MGTNKTNETLTTQSRHGTNVPQTTRNYMADLPKDNKLRPHGLSGPCPKCGSSFSLQDQAKRTPGNRRKINTFLVRKPTHGQRAGGLGGLGWTVICRVRPSFGAFSCAQTRRMVLRSSVTKRLRGLTHHLLVSVFSTV